LKGIKNCSLENIFIDTSVFVAENFLHGNRIKELYRLFGDGHFKNVMPLVTINEIKSQFAKRAGDALELHNAAMNNRKLQVLKNLKGSKDILTKFPKLDIIEKEFSLKLDRRIKAADAIVLTYPTIDTTILLDKYFKGEKPFGKADKKHEFPDAIALQTLIQWCEENKEKCVVLTNDHDFSVGNPLIKIELDYKKFLDEALTRILDERKQVVDLLFKDNKVKIQTEVELWIRDKLDDTNKYYDLANWMGCA
jgi:hypothetical protein